MTTLYNVTGAIVGGVTGGLAGVGVGDGPIDSGLALAGATLSDGRRSHRLHHHEIGAACTEGTELEGK